MTNVERLFAAVAEEPWATMLILADALEEAGDMTAPGYRMLAESKRFPYATTKGDWMWYKDEWKEKGKDVRDCLPEDVYEALYTRYDTDTFDTHMDAFNAAATAWSEVLANA